MKYNRVKSQEEKFINSQQTQFSWCKQNNIANSTFSRWLVEYKNKRKVDFVPVLPSKTEPNHFTKTDSKTTIVVQVGNCKFYLPQEITLALLTKAMNEVQADV